MKPKDKRGEEREGWQKALADLAQVADELRSTCEMVERDGSTPTQAMDAVAAHLDDVLMGVVRLGHEVGLAALVSEAPPYAALREAALRFGRLNASLADSPEVVKIVAKDKERSEAWATAFAELAKAASDVARDVDGAEVLRGAKAR